MRKKLLSSLLVTAMAVTMLAGCGSNGGQQAATPATDNKTETSAEAKTDDTAGTTTTDGGKIGVAMPTKDLQRWNQDGTNMEAQLKEAGYEVDLQYASNDIPTQVSQIENMINSGCQMLVIASIDGDSLGTVLEQAKEKDIPVIAYDRLIMNSDAVTYYATFDNYMVGTKQGEYIRDQLDLDNAAGPFNIELVTGDPGDNNARFFFGGAMDVLQPYIDAGKLVVKSGQTDFETVATANWSTGPLSPEWTLSFPLTMQTEPNWMQFCAPTTLPHLVLPTLWKLTTPASGPSLPVRTVISPTLRT